MVSARAHSVSNTGSDKCGSRSSRCRGVKRRSSRAEARRAQSYFGGETIRGFAVCSHDEEAGKEGKEGEEEPTLSSRAATVARGFDIVISGRLPRRGRRASVTAEAGEARPSLRPARFLDILSETHSHALRAGCSALPRASFVESSSLAEPEHNARSNHLTRTDTCASS